MAKGKNSGIAVFGLKKCGEENQSSEHRYQYQYRRKVQPSNEGRMLYNEPDPNIDRKAQDYINRIHRDINSQD